MAKENKEIEEYGRRIDDLIRYVQEVNREVDDFLKGRMKFDEPYQVRQKKNELSAKQTAAMRALNDALAGQRELLGQMKDTGEPLPKRRASDYPPGAPRQQPRLRSVEDKEIAELRRRAGITEVAEDTKNIEDMNPREFAQLQGETENDYMRDVQMQIWKQAQQKKHAQKDMDPKRAMSLLQTIAANVDNEDLSDGEFRQFVRRSL